MSEEIHDAAMTVPRAVMGSIVINGVLGFGMLMGALFTLGNIETVLETPYGYPFIQIFLDSTGSIGGATTMSSVLLALTFFSTIGLVASSSRMTWAFARDRGLPGWRYMSKVSQSRFSREA
jgi:choline transport protein